MNIHFTTAGVKNLDGTFVEPIGIKRSLRGIPAEVSVFSKYRDEAGHYHDATLVFETQEDSWLDSAGNRRDTLLVNYTLHDNGGDPGPDPDHDPDLPLKSFTMTAGLAFGIAHGYATPVIGLTETVGAISREPHETLPLAALYYVPEPYNPVAILQCLFIGPDITSEFSDLIIVINGTPYSGFWVYSEGVGPTFVIQAPDFTVPVLQEGETYDISWQRV